MEKLKHRYKKEVVPALLKHFGYKNPMQVPSLVKVVVSSGIGEATRNPKSIDIAASELAVITGQKPLYLKAKRAISAFSLKEGTPIGLKVTLRGDRMYEFMDKLINICFPKIRDFKGLSPKSFDGDGNYTIGIKEQLIFPEVDYDKVDKIRGMAITICTTAKTDAESLELLKLLGIPFRS